MKKSSLFVGLLVLLFSCNSNKSSNSEESSSSDTVAKIMIPESSCYSSVIEKDTMLLKLENFPNVVTGVLKYKFFEKDNNEGTLEGKLVGDKIFADYTFQSEGETSVREVAFLIDGNKVIEGFGEMIEVDGKEVFKDKKKITYKGGITFSTIDCAENDEKFRLKY